MDYLLANPEAHETIMKEIISFYEGVRNMEKKWEKKKIENWKEWPSRAREYMEGLLREMRNNKHIDNLEHHTYVEALKKNYR